MDIRAGCFPASVPAPLNTGAYPHAAITSPSTVQPSKANPPCSPTMHALCKTALRSTDEVMRAAALQKSGSLLAGLLQQHSPTPGPLHIPTPACMLAPKPVAHLADPSSSQSAASFTAPTLLADARSAQPSSNRPRATPHAPPSQPSASMPTPAFLKSQFSPDARQQALTPLTALLAALTDPSALVRATAASSLSQLPASMLHVNVSKRPHSSSSSTGAPHALSTLDSSTCTAAPSDTRECTSQIASLEAQLSISTCQSGGPQAKCPVFKASSVSDCATVAVSDSLASSAPLSCTSNLPSTCGTAPLASQRTTTAQAEADGPLISLDPRHPLVAGLLHSFVSALLHPCGPLWAFREPEAVVRAVTALLQGHAHHNSQMLHALPMGRLAVAGVAFGTHATWAVQQQAQHRQKAHSENVSSRDAGKAWRDGGGGLVGDDFSDGQADQIGTEVSGNEANVNGVSGASDGCGMGGSSHRGKDRTKSVTASECEDDEGVHSGGVEVLAELPRFWAALARVGSLEMENFACKASEATWTGLREAHQVVLPPYKRQNGQHKDNSQQQGNEQGQQQQQQPLFPQQPVLQGDDTHVCSPTISIQALTALEACVGLVVTTAEASAAASPWAPPVSHNASTTTTNSTVKGMDSCIATSAYDTDSNFEHGGKGTSTAASAIGGAAAWCSFSAASAATALLAQHALPLASSSSMGSIAANSDQPQQNTRTSLHHPVSTRSSIQQHPHNASPHPSGTCDLSPHTAPVPPLPAVSSTRSKLLSLAVQLLALCEAPPASLYTDQFGAIKSCHTPWVPSRAQNEDPTLPAEALERQVGTAWLAHALAHMAGTAIAGCPFPVPAFSSPLHNSCSSNNSNRGKSSPGAFTEQEREHAQESSSAMEPGEDAGAKQQGSPKSTQHSEEHAVAAGQQHRLRSGLVVEVVDLSETGPGSSSREGTPIYLRGKGECLVEEGEEQQQHHHQQQQQQQQKKQEKQQPQQPQQQHAEVALREQAGLAWTAGAVVKRLLLMWAAHAPHQSISTPWCQVLLQQQQQQQKQDQPQQPEQQQHELPLLLSSMPAEAYTTLLSTLSTSLRPSSSLPHSSLPPSPSALKAESSLHPNSTTPNELNLGMESQPLTYPVSKPCPDASGLIALSTVEVQKQQLLVLATEECVPDLRRIVAASPDVLASQDTSNTRSTWDRYLAARQAARFALGLCHPFLSRVSPILLAAAVTAVHDPSPAIAVHGMRMLHHLAAEGLSADLRWQSELLLGVASKMVVGCDESVWHAAAPAAVALVLAIEASNNPRSPRCHALLNDLLFEVDLGGHKQSRRLPFLSSGVLHALLDRLGLTVVRHMSRLLPLLLEWLHSYDSTSREGAARCLSHLITNTWPRIPYHAPVLWQHLVVLVAKETAVAAAGVMQVSSPLSVPGAASGKQASTSLPPPSAVAAHTQASPSTSVPGAAAAAGKQASPPIAAAAKPPSAVTAAVTATAQGQEPMSTSEDASAAKLAAMKASPPGGAEPLRGSNAPSRAQAEAAGVQVVSEALAAAEACIHAGKTNWPSLLALGVGSSPLSAHSHARGPKVNASPDPAAARSCSSSSNPVLQAALHACLLLASCCGSCPPFWAAVQDTERTLQPAGKGVCVQGVAAQATESGCRDAQCDTSLSSDQATSRAGLAVLLNHLHALAHPL